MHFYSFLKLGGVTLAAGIQSQSATFCCFAEFLLINIIQCGFTQRGSNQPFSGESGAKCGKPQSCAGLS